MLHVRRLRVAALAAVGGALLVPALAAAHPLGNFTINHYSGVRVAADGVVVDHVIDMAEIPTFSALREVDTDGDGVASDAERATAAQARCTDQAGALALTAGGAPVPLSVAASTVSFPPGQGAPTMRLVCRLTGSVPAGVAGPLTFADPTFAERAGWREIVVQGDGMTVAGDVASVGRSERLTAYPTGLLAQASAVSSVAFSVTAGGPGLAPLVQPEIDAAAAGSAGAAGAGAAGAAGSAGSGAPVAAVPGGIAELSGDIAAVFQADELTPWVLVLSMLAAAGLGALHALSPGHGKTVMAAYLVGSRGTARQALGLGTTVTVSHTLGVLALGALSLSASAIIPPERLYPILGVVSGAIVIVIAGWLLLSMGRRWWTARSARLAAAAAYGHEHAHDHDHGHDHGHAHPHVAHAEAHAHADHGHEHPHPHPHAASAATAAPAAQHADHGHDHPHPHPHAAPAADHPADHAPEADGWHSHGGIRHTHVPQGDGPLRWRALFALGLAGGMVPSVSAIILLLGSIAAGRPAYGIALTIAFGIGMAVVLVGIGVGLVYARGLLERMPRRAPGRSLGRFVPAGSAAVMLVAGLLITAQAAVTLR